MKEDQPLERKNLTVPKKILFPLIDRGSEVVLVRQKTVHSRARLQGRILSVLALPNETDPDALVPLEDKASLSRQLELQIKGHQRRPSKKPQRTRKEGARKAEAKSIREGAEPNTISEQFDLWINPTTPPENRPMNVFIAQQDLVRIREIVGMSNASPDTEDIDPEVLEILNADQELYSGTLCSEEGDGLKPILQGPAIHWVERASEISE